MLRHALTSIQQSVFAILKYLERITKTDIRYLIKNAVYLWGNHGIGVLNGFVLYLIYAHYLPQSVFGEYKYLL